MATHKENNIVKLLGVLSALTGGSGGQVANAYLQGQQGKDQANYGRAMAAYQAQQGQQQQQFENTQAQVQSSDSLMDNLKDKDAATQQSIVEGMTPQVMQAYGYTPDSIKAQFYNADGTFKPVAGGDDPKGDAALIRAQSDARSRLFSITPQAQQSLHDGMDKETWESTYGVPYEGYSPGQLTKDVNAGASVQGRADAETAAAQKGALSTLLTMSPAMQATILAGTNPQAFAQKYGVPVGAFKPGMMPKDAAALAAIAERWKASQLAAQTQTSIAGSKDAVTERGQDLTAAARSRGLSDKEQGIGSVGSGGKSGTAADQAYARRLQRMTVLATPAKDPLTGKPTGLSPAHQGGAAYQEYISLKKLNDAYEARNAGASGGTAGAGTAQANPYLNMTPQQRLQLARQRGLIQ